MSKNYKQFAEEDYIVTVGSPSDIRKVIRSLEADGYYNLYCDRPVLREGRLYYVRYPENPGAYVIGKEA